MHPHGGRQIVEILASLAPVIEGQAQLKLGLGEDTLPLDEECPYDLVSFEVFRKVKVIICIGFFGLLLFFNSHISVVIGDVKVLTIVTIWCEVCGSQPSDGTLLQEIEVRVCHIVIAHMSPQCSPQLFRTMKTCWRSL